MRTFLLVLPFLVFPLVGLAQTQPEYILPAKPWYCNPPDTQFTVKGGSPIPPMPTQPVTCYKVQVAILTETHPASFPFHPKLVARYRPCEEVWVIESRNTYKFRDEAEQFSQDMKDVGYKGAYVTEVIGYE